MSISGSGDAHVNATEAHRGARWPAPATSPTRAIRTTCRAASRAPARSKRRTERGAARLAHRLSRPTGRITGLNAAGGRPRCRHNRRRRPPCPACCNLHFANRFETLADQLVRRLGEQAAGRSAFEADEVIVPSAAITRRLIIELARRQGVCANVNFSYLARWLWQQTDAAGARLPESAQFDADVFAWRILAAFEDAAWSAAQPRLSAWLAQADAVMRHELARRVAGLFDQYLTYRPEWLEAWFRNETVALPRRRRRRRARPAMAGRAVAPPRRRDGQRRPPSDPGAAGAARRARHRPGRHRHAARQRPRVLPADDAAGAPGAAAAAGHARRPACLRAQPEPGVLVRRRRPRRLAWLAARGEADVPRAGQPPARRLGPADAVGAGPAGRRRRPTAWSTTPLRAGRLRQRARRAAGRGAGDDASSRPARWPRWPATAASRCTSATRSRASSRCCTTACSR